MEERRSVLKQAVHKRIQERYGILLPQPGCRVADIVYKEVKRSDIKEENNDMEATRYQGYNIGLFASNTIPIQYWYCNTIQYQPGRHAYFNINVLLLKKITSGNNRLKYV